MTQAFPLQWPDGWPRTPDGKRRQYSRFDDWPFGTARDKLLAELHRMGAKNVVLSSDIPLRNDGLPYANFRAPDNPGIAVYFALNGEPKAMARDGYCRIVDNVRSLTLAIMGLRQLERHGGARLFDRAFERVKCLPALERRWDVLGVSREASKEEIEPAYHVLGRKFHSAWLRSI